MASKKVCIITSVHPPFDVRIFHKEAKSLVQAGYGVTLITQHDKGAIVDGVKIINLQRPRNRIERMTKTVWSAFRQALAVNADVYHFHDPELLPLGLLLKIIGYKVIYDVHEDVPRQTLSKHYLPVIIRKPMSWVIGVVEWIGAKAFDAIIPATPKIAEHFPKHKTVIVQNFPIIDELVNVGQALPYSVRPKSFVYVGGIATIRGVEEMIRAFHLLADIPGTRLDLAGEFSPSSFEDALRVLPGWSSVTYHGQVSRALVAQIMGGVRAGLVTLHPLVNYLNSYPIKMFEYMAVGLPVIASDFPLWRRIIEDAGCGLLVDPMDPKAIAAALRWILDHPTDAEAMGQRGRQTVLRIYNWDAEAVKLINLYNKLLGT